MHWNHGLNVSTKQKIYTSVVISMDEGLCYWMFSFFCDLDDFIVTLPTLPYETNARRRYNRTTLPLIKSRISSSKPGIE